MKDRIIGYGVSWLGPDRHPDTVKRRYRGEEIEVPHSMAGKPIHHSERFKTIEAARQYCKQLSAVSGRKRIELHKIRLMDDIPGFPMSIWDKIDQ
jgi:hypothetical protein